MEEQQTNTEQIEQEATTIGMFLKYTRLKQKKSIEEASEALCIRKVYIKALEDDDYETLPPIPYGVGFVRSYAAYLGLNAQRIAQIYKQQAFPQKEKNVQTVVTEHTELTIPKKKQIFIALAAIVLLYVLYLGGRAVLDREDIDVAQIEPRVIVANAEAVLPRRPPGLRIESRVPRDEAGLLQDREVFRERAAPLHAEIFRQFGAGARSGGERAENLALDAGVLAKDIVENLPEVAEERAVCAKAERLDILRGGERRIDLLQVPGDAARDG